MSPIRHCRHNKLSLELPHPTTAENYENKLALIVRNVEASHKVNLAQIISTLNKRERKLFSPTSLHIHVRDRIMIIILSVVCCSTANSTNSRMNKICKKNNCDLAFGLVVLAKKGPSKIFGLQIYFAICHSSTEIKYTLAELLRMYSLSEIGDSN